MEVGSGVDVVIGGRMLERFRVFGLMRCGRPEFPTHFLLLVGNHAEDLDVDHDHHAERHVERGHCCVDLVPGNPNAKLTISVKVSQ